MSRGNTFDRFRYRPQIEGIARGTNMKCIERETTSGFKHTELTHLHKMSLFNNRPVCITKRKNDRTKPVINIKKRKKRKVGARADLTKAQKKEVFFLFYPEARNARGQDSSYPCIICQENMMVLDGTMSWNASHIRPIRHCPERDPRYAIPTCTSCNGKMGIGKESYKNSFDMMVRYGGRYKGRVYPIAKTLRERYDDKGLTVLQFVYENYGKATINQEGRLDSHLIISDAQVYHIISKYESREIKKEMELELHKKSEKIKEIHEKIKELLSKVEEIREEEKNALIKEHKSEQKYIEIREQVFDQSGLFE